jgi:putative transposase
VKTLDKNNHYLCRQKRGMQNYRKTSHTTYDCKYHIVWITKYRKPVMTGLSAVRIRELIRDICKEHEVEILHGHISSDHIHLLVSVPPHLAIGKLVQYLKEKSSKKLLMENEQLSKMFWGRHLWGRGYFVATAGTITDEIIKSYIENQDDSAEQQGNFTIG